MKHEKTSPQQTLIYKWMWALWQSFLPLYLALFPFVQGAFGDGGEPISAGTNVAASLTTLEQVRYWTRQATLTNLPISLTNVVAGVFPELSLVILHDEIGNAGIQLDLQRYSWLKPRQRIRLQGCCQFGGGCASLLPSMVVNNDGLHPAQEASGEICLTKGRHPLRVEFFQLANEFGLKVEYEGPGIRRQTLPREKLTYITNPEETLPHYEPGVAYEYYEGAWNGVPDFNQLLPSRSGSVPDIQMPPQLRSTNFGICLRADLKIDEPGKYRFYLTSDDGSRLLLQAISPGVELLGDNESWEDSTNALNLDTLQSEREEYCLGTVEGKVAFVGGGARNWQLELISEGTSLTLQLDNTSVLPPWLTKGKRIRATGFCMGGYDKSGHVVPSTLLLPGVDSISMVPDPSESTKAEGLPVLTTAEQIRLMKPKDAARGYPVRLRGLITVRRVIPEGILQDMTSGVYVFFKAPDSWRLRSGDYCEITGTTAPGGFANLVVMHDFKILGTGIYPEPLRPDYGRLIDGSMDCQWVELQGLVSAVLDERNLQLTVRGGKVRAEFHSNADLSFLAGLSNAFIRVRGCVIPGRNDAGQVTKDITIWPPSTACLSVDQPPTNDPFTAPLKEISSLYLFEPNPNYHEFIHVRGQILLVSDSVLYFSDGKNSLQIVPKSAPALRAGDLVEAVGLPDMFNTPPSLIESSIRKIGSADLPGPPMVDLADVSKSDYSGKRVRLEGLLVDLHEDNKQWFLVLQSGLRTIQAIGPKINSTATIPPLGSRVALCGVVRNQRWKETANAGGTELLLNSLSDITVLHLPPFWTTSRVVLLLIVLICAFLLAGLWIKLLRRTVSKRTEALQSEMNERQSAEDKLRRLHILNALEAERTRIARNIHDDLGARVTKLSRLATQIRVTDALSQARLDDIAATSRQMVEALDETVWTVNPVNDSLPKLSNYIAHFAEEFFHNTSIRCELDIPLTLPEVMVTAELRFNLLLVIKEALNNVLKHACARSVLIRMEYLPGNLRWTIQDDGRGFAVDAVTRRSGMANLQTRVKALGGQITIHSTPGTGTEILVVVPLVDSAAQLATGS